MEEQRKGISRQGWSIFFATITLLSLIGAPALAGPQDGQQGIATPSMASPLDTTRLIRDSSLPDVGSQPVPPGTLAVREVGPGQTYATIQDAINASLSGDTINVHAGTYQGSIDVQGFTGLHFVGEGKATTLVRPIDRVSWGDETDYGDSRKAAVRVVDSTDVTFEGFTFDFQFASGSDPAFKYCGMLYWDSTGTVNNNILKNMQVDDHGIRGLEEMTIYVIGYLPLYSDVSRAHVTFSNNQFIDTGRLAIVSHDYSDVTVTHNSFSKTVDDFGYALEIGSGSEATITYNTFDNFDTPAWSDGSSVDAIYVENCWGYDHTVIKHVVIDHNEISHCQGGIAIGNEWPGFAIDVEIVATVTNNYIHDATLVEVPGDWDEARIGITITDEGAIYGSSTTATCSGNMISNCGDYGYQIYTTEGNGDIAAIIDGDTITGNAIGIHLLDNAKKVEEPVGSSYDVTVQNCIISGQTTNGIVNEFLGDPIQAEYNYWGSGSGPSGTNGVVGFVDCKPYVTSAPWEVELTFTGDGHADNVIFGEKTTASDLQDSFDVPKPGQPPHPYVQAWFNASMAAPYNMLWNDYRHFPHLDQIWYLTVKADTTSPTLGPTDVTVTWDPEDVAASEYDQVELQTLAGGFIADLKTDTDGVVLVDLADDTPYHYRIYCHRAPTANVPPTAVDDGPINAIEETPIAISILANDYDTDGALDITSVHIVNDADHGTTSVNPLTGVVSYTSSTDYTGIDSFTYTVKDDDEAESNEATVSITVGDVNDAPTADDDEYDATEDVTLAVTAVNGVLANDNDPDEDTLTAVKDTDPLHGTLTLALDGSFSYIPELNWHGIVTFTYHANDGDLDSNIATVTITVGSVNDAPVADDDSAVVDEDSLDNVIDVLTGDTDVDVGDVLVVDSVGSASHGTVALVGGVVKYTPAANYNGLDEFDYVVSDGHGGTDTGHVSVTVSSVNDAPTVNPDSGETDNETAITINVLANDVDDGSIDVTSVIIIDTPGHGSAVPDSLGVVTYTPIGDFFGLDTFTYTVDDTLGATSNEATVTITRYHSFDLSASWNLISLPLYDTISKDNLKVRYGGEILSWADASDMEGTTIVLNTIYDWIRGATPAYCDVTTLMPGEGYWVWAYLPCEILVYSTATAPVEEPITALLANWNIMGLPYADQLGKLDLHITSGGTLYHWNEAIGGADPILLGFIYGWDAVHQYYTLANTLTPGQGYWMYAFHDATLNRGD